MLIHLQVPKTFRDFFHERLTRWGYDRVAVNEPDTRPNAAYDDRVEISYGKMLDVAYDLAGWMRERGVKAGTFVAIGGTNSIGWLTTYVAINLLGAVAVCLNSTL